MIIAPYGQTMRTSATLDQVCTRITDGTHLTPKFIEHGIPFLFVSNIVDGRISYKTTKFISHSAFAALSERCPVEPGDVLYTIVGSYGNAAVVEDQRPFSFQRHIAHIKPDRTKLDPRYLRLVLASPLVRRQVDSLVRGIAQKTLNLAQLKSITIELPPLSEQRRIAAILDKADAIRRNREEGIRLTEELLRSTFLDMFGDPATNPKKWPVLPMDQLVNECQYGTAQKANGDKNGIPVLRMNNITYSGEIDLTDIKWCEISGADIPQYTVRKGDLLFNRTNSPELVGKTAVWDRDDPYAFAGYLVRVRFDESRALPDYVSAYLNSDYGKKMLFARAKPSNNMSNLSAGEFRRIPLPVPSIESQYRFASLVLKARTVKAQRVACLASCSSLFSALVQRAFRGEL